MDSLVAEAGRLEDRVCDPVGGQGVGTYGDVCSPVQGQPALVTRCKVCLISQHGARTFSAAAAGEGRLEFYLKVNEQSAGSVQKQFASIPPLDCAPTERQHQVFA